MPPNVFVDAGVTGQYKVCGKPWSVGHKYILHEYIGGGSYGDVCKATDVETNQIVALKRVPNVLCCPLLAKRVLREVCIMRRLSHPHVISLTDVFIFPSSEVEGGFDLYIATEFAAGGDLYHLREPLSANDVKVLIWQLLLGVQYLHSCRVWHRDIKSENVLLISRRHVKICDFGLSRSAEEAASTFEVEQISLDGRKAQIKKVLTRQYTKMVVTPSYRAPEVIMSRGQYNSTIDIWSLGCIFWELLVRSINYHFTGPLASPLFGVRGEPLTPPRGENYAKDSHSPLAEQLNVIFDVIGTPCWKEIENVPSESWRAYLKCLPGRAGSLSKNLQGVVDDNAIDLLSRMLAFDPARRCTAEEALAHVYFKNIRRPVDFKQNLGEDTFSAICTGSLWKIRDPSAALQQLELELEASEKEFDGGKSKLISLLDSEIQHQQKLNLDKKSMLYQLASSNFHLLPKQDAPVQTSAPTPQSVSYSSVYQDVDSRYYDKSNNVRPTRYSRGVPKNRDQYSNAGKPCYVVKNCNGSNCVLGLGTDSNSVDMQCDDVESNAGKIPFIPLPRRSPRLRNGAGPIPYSKRAHVDL